MNLVHVGVGEYVEFATHCLLGLRIIMCVFMAIHIRCWHTYRYVNCTYELLPPPIHLYYMLVIDHMVPMCIMEVASRHLILLTSPPPTVAPLEPGSVSIMGLPLPFQVGPGEGGVGVWAVTGSGPGHVIPPQIDISPEVCRPHWNQGTPLCDIYYMTEIHVCSKLYQCISSTFMRAVSIIVGHGILCTLEHRCFAHMLGGL